MDAVHLVELIASWEKRNLGDELEEHAAEPPDVHLLIVVTVGHETLGCPVPAGRDVLRVRLLAVFA